MAIFSDKISVGLKKVAKNFIFNPKNCKTASPLEQNTTQFQ